MTRQNLSPVVEARERFDGAKVALFVGDKLIVIRRDDIAGLPYPGCLDLPGGEREPGETPEACAVREVKEEVGLELAEDALLRPGFYEAPVRAWFFAAYLPAESADEIVFGNEGQGWSLMDPTAYVTAEDAVPHFRERVRAVLEAAPGREP